MEPSRLDPDPDPVVGGFHDSTGSGSGSGSRVGSTGVLQARAGIAATFLITAYAVPNTLPASH